MTVFLKEVQVPEKCYLFEAVTWITLGRVPEYVPSYLKYPRPDASDDIRVIWEEECDLGGSQFGLPLIHKQEISFREMVYSGGQCPSDREKAELALSLIPWPVKKDGGPIVKSAHIEWMAREVEADPEGQKNTKHHGSPTEEIDVPLLRSKAESWRSAESIAERMYSGLWQRHQSSWASVFQRISSGELAVWAVEADKCPEWSYSEVQYVAFEKMPPEAFTYDFVWESPNSEIGGKLFYKFVVNTEELFELFPPRGFERSTKMKAVGNFWEHRAGEKPAKKVGRGRKPKIDWALPKKILKDMHTAGETPSGITACVEEIRARTQALDNITLGTTTISANLSMELEEIYGGAK